MCGGGGGDESQVTVANGNHQSGKASRSGVTSDEAESAPRLRVTYGEDSMESDHHSSARAETHTAEA